VNSFLIVSLLKKWYNVMIDILLQCVTYVFCGFMFYSLYLLEVEKDLRRERRREERDQ